MRLWSFLACVLPLACASDPAAVEPPAGDAGNAGRGGNSSAGAGGRGGAFAAGSGGGAAASGSLGQAGFGAAGAKADAGSGGAGAGGGSGVAGTTCCAGVGGEASGGSAGAGGVEPFAGAAGAAAGGAGGDAAGGVAGSGEGGASSGGEAGTGGSSTGGAAGSSGTGGSAGTSAGAAGMGGGATCTDGKKNQSESDIDCGGTACAGCAIGRSCASGADCADGKCAAGTCVVPVALATFGTPSSTPAPDIDSFRIGDFDNDKKLDFVYQHASAKVLAPYSASPTGFTPLPKITYPTGSFGPELADMNLDGNLDIVMANYGAGMAFSGGTPQVFHGFGQGAFYEAGGFSTLGGGLAIALADFDQDGRTDVAVTRNVQAACGIIRNQPDGKYFAVASLQGAKGSHHIVAKDVDDDGKADILLGSDLPSVRLFRGLGNSAFAPAVDLPTELPLRRFKVEDVDGDGKRDLVALGSFEEPSPACNCKGYLAIAKNLGGGSFAPVVVRNLDMGVPVAGNFAVADFNGDGLPDIALGARARDAEGSPRDVISLLYGRPDGGYFQTRGLQLTNEPRSITAVDMDGDARPDLVYAAGGQLNVRSNTTGK